MSIFSNDMCQTIHTPKLCNAININKRKHMKLLNLINKKIASKTFITYNMLINLINLIIDFGPIGSR